jgi:hypothetical protein
MVCIYSSAYKRALLQVSGSLPRTIRLYTAQTDALYKRHKTDDAANYLATMYEATAFHLENASALGVVCPRTK